MASFALARGLSLSLSSVESRRWENSVQAGGNDFLTTASQTAHLYATISFAQEAWQACNKSSLALPAICNLIPFGLFIIKDVRILPQKAKPVFDFLHQHFGIMLMITDIACTILLLYSGQTIFALTSAFILTLGILDQKALLPTYVRIKFHQISPLLLIATAFWTGTIFQQMLAFMNSAAFVYESFFSKAAKVQLMENSLTFDFAQKFFEEKVSFSVDKNYVHYDPLPKVPDIDIKLLLDSFDSIDWTMNNYQTLRKKLDADIRFQRQHKTTIEKTDQELQKITRDSLQKFVASIKNRSITKGEPSNYQRLEVYLKHITKYIQDCKDPIQVVDMLFCLAIDGGEYCGPGIYHTVEDMYGCIQQLSEVDEVSLRDKIIILLKEERIKIFQSEYQEMVHSLSDFFFFFDLLDIHNYNQYTSLYGENLGILGHSSDRSKISYRETLGKVLVYPFKCLFERDFWIKNTPQHYVEILNEFVGTQALPRLEIWKFWEKWIDNLSYSEDEKNNLKSSLINSLELANQKIDPQFFQLMLYQMGILKIA